MDPWTRLAPVGMEVALKLLRSICVSTEGLAAEIQPCDGSRRKRIPVYEVAAELEELKEAMSWIYGVLLDADLLRASDGRALALHARDAAFGLENLVDVLEGRRLQSELDPPTKFGTNPHILWKSLICCPGVSFLKRKELLKDLRFVAKEARTLVHLLGEGTGPSSLNPPLLDPPGSGSRDGQIDLAEKRHTVFGRDKERDEILRMLTKTGGQPQLKIIAIIGFGGVGKTTLAQLAYNDTRVEQHFEVRSWVFVSNSFGRLEVTAEILRSAQPAWEGSADKMFDFEMLQSELRRFVASKRCLIVLDGIWAAPDDMKAAWQDILTPLQSAGTGSKILVTARTNTVPHMMGASHIFPLNPMGTDDFLALFKGHAFGSNSDYEHPELQPIWCAALRKIHGLPLAAKVLGKLLGTTRSKEQRKNIMCTLIQDDDVFPGLPNNITGTLLHDDAVLPALRLGYKYLPGHLKRCFAYCSLFPKNWTFDPAHLIHLWIAEGFVQPVSTCEERIEDRAQEYFDQLLSRSFFQELMIGSKIYYKVHDLLHDLAEFIAAKDCFLVERAENWGIPTTVRRLSVTMNNLHGLVSFCNLKRLHTLLVLRSVPFSSNWFEMDLMEKLTNLRVLDLSGCNLTEMPQSVGKLFHLRYLSVRGTIQRLPESIGKLLHLQYLCFSGNCSLENLPAAISVLVNLRHLLVPTKYTADLVGIRRLVNLQGSLELHVEKFEGRKVEELRNINGLRGFLKIKGLENVSSNGEACKAELNKKRYLDSLILEWSSAHRNIHTPADKEVLEGLMPHPELRELHIRRYRGTIAPSWLEPPLLPQLQSLHLINCRSLRILPPLGHLRSLRTLCMKELCSIIRIDHEFYGSDVVAFPSLTVLEFFDFPRLQEWSGTAGRKSFPCLEKLVLMDCPNLNRIPLLPSSTTEVSIERTRLAPYMRLAHLSSSSEMLQLDVCTTCDLFKSLLHKVHVESIVTLNISGAEPLLAAEGASSLVSLQRLQLSRINFTDQTLTRFLQAVPCLSSLEIIGLANIAALPVRKELKFCMMLRELCIRDCQALQSLSSLQFLPSLRHLVIERCPKLTAASFPVNFGSLSSLKFLTISYCSELQSLPMPSSLETVHLIGCHPELSRMNKKRPEPLLRSFPLYLKY